MRPDFQGKVRDIYDLGDRLLLVASDRISAFDVVLPEAIPFKGEVLTKLTLHWFELLQDIVETHLISTDVSKLPERFAPHRDYLRGRSMIVRKAEVFPVECIVRGYITGSGWKEYLRMGAICGVPLPEGLVESQRLEAPIFTPSTKAFDGGHDEYIDFEQVVQTIGQQHAETIRSLSLDIYSTAHEHACSRGVIIADTKFEFGTVDGRVILVDEALTPDSSRFWPADLYAPGQAQASFDKQFVRDWLEASDWDKVGAPPSLPVDVVEATSRKYIQAYEAITGRSFVPEGDG
ncbi:MAG: phosphoribosylaminoimidazolesuccinocarboxamide synthase [Actinobacteria bacterium]|nr:phosphoribosylaminoimidazolesuccinocarboxamide synthase [Actinomycetota bacterium]MCL5887747.1 phosphoribosylaminoimidazolesuccinocarboxamide synthase [Actinomycetota bacterium]